jgi:hypothetical protein
VGVIREKGQSDPRRPFIYAGALVLIFILLQILIPTSRSVGPPPGEYRHLSQPEVGRRAFVGPDGPEFSYMVGDHVLAVHAPEQASTLLKACVDPARRDQLKDERQVREIPCGTEVRISEGAPNSGLVPVTYMDRQWWVPRKNLWEPIG